MEETYFSDFTAILREELIPAMGCTEPIALAYAASIAKKELGVLPDRVLVEASGSIIKNVKSVIVPNTDHMKGIAAAAAVGIVAGNPDKQLEVIADVTPEQIEDIRRFLKEVPIDAKYMDLGHVFDIRVTLWKGESYSKVRITDYHTNVVLIEKDGKVLKQIDTEKAEETEMVDRNVLTMERIWEYINHVDLETVKDILDPQMKYNMAIAEEGMKNNYGANIGKILIQTEGNDVATRAKAYAAAGSDARMNGCELPVVINSGSGNQGITVSVPVMVYAKELGSSQEQLYRALLLSNLTAIHQKSKIGTLSAFCGAINAGAGAGAGIAYLRGADYDAVIHTVVNALAIVSGVICDGAKASCAGKIATGVEAGILGYNMYKNGQQFYGGDGIVGKDVEESIGNVGILGKDGMKETNEVIIRIMMGEK